MSIPLRERISAIGHVVDSIARRQEATGTNESHDILMSLVNAELHLLEQEQARYDALVGGAHARP